MIKIRQLSASYQYVISMSMLSLNIPLIPPIPPIPWSDAVIPIEQPSDSDSQILVLPAPQANIQEYINQHIQQDDPMGDE